jgi:hypothetical protein
VLAQTVSDLLAKRWSPEQVAHELREVFAGEQSRWLCKETIYQAIYDPAVQITRPARRRRRRRRLTAMRMIDERPVEVEDRAQAGHWDRWDRHDPDHVVEVWIRMDYDDRPTPWGRLRLVQPARGHYRRTNRHWKRGGIRPCPWRSIEWLVPGERWTAALVQEARMRWVEAILGGDGHHREIT